LTERDRQTPQLMMPWQPGRTVSTAGAAERLRCSRDTVQRYVQEGRLEGFKRRKKSNSPLLIILDSVVRLARERPHDTRKTITVQSARKKLRCSKSFVIALIRDGALEAYRRDDRPGSQFLIVYDSLVQLTHRWREESGADLAGEEESTATVAASDLPGAPRP